MARVAYVMDKLMRKIGLSGRSIVPMLLGFGCSVPAVMSTRTLSSSRDRRMTIMLTPFMSCSAKIPIYAVFTAAFFLKYRALVMIGCTQPASHRHNRGACIQQESSAASPSLRDGIAELQVPFHKERLFDVRARIFDARLDHLIATVVIWFLQSFDTRLNVVADSADSILAAIGKFIAPVFRPLASTTGACRRRLSQALWLRRPLSAPGRACGNRHFKSRHGSRHNVHTSDSRQFSLSLLYTPCVAAVAAIKRSWSGVAVFSSSPVRRRVDCRFRGTRPVPAYLIRRRL